jgi:hypothetical protein
MNFRHLSVHILNPRLVTDASPEFHKMKFVLVNNEEDVAILLSSISVILMDDDEKELQEVPLSAVLAVDEQVPMLSLDFKNRFFAAVKHREKAKRLELQARLTAYSRDPEK